MMLECMMSHTLAAVGTFPAAFSAAARLAYLAQSAPAAPTPPGCPFHCPITQHPHSDRGWLWRCPTNQPGCNGAIERDAFDDAFERDTEHVVAVYHLAAGAA